MQIISPAKAHWLLLNIQKTYFCYRMKNIFIAIFLLPALAFAQNNATFSITGHVTGFPDGTVVSFFNRSTNGLDSATIIENNSFVINGTHLEEPDFRFLVFNRQQPVIPVLLQNDKVLITGASDSLSNLNISGSAVNEDYKKLSVAYAAYNDIFQSQNFSPENIDLISKASEKFIEENPKSFVGLLAVSQIYQISHNAIMAENLMQKIDQTQKGTELAKYLTQQINAEKVTSVGAHILPFIQNDTNGRPVNISDFKGRYVLIDFWASWCRPCRIENPNVVANYNRFKDKNFTILGVSLDQSKPAWEKAIKDDKLTWTHVSDLKGWQNSVSTRFNIFSIPANILIDPNGIIVAKNVRGEDLGHTLENLLDK